MDNKQLLTLIKRGSRDSVTKEDLMSNLKVMVASGLWDNMPAELKAYNAGLARNPAAMMAKTFSDMDPDAQKAMADSVTEWVTEAPAATVEVKA